MSVLLDRSLKISQTSEILENDHIGKEVKKIKKIESYNIVRNVRLPKSGGIPPWRKFALKYLKACLTRYIHGSTLTKGLIFPIAKFWLT